MIRKSIVSIAALGMALGLTAGSSGAFAGGPETLVNPIFGHALVQKMSASENKAVVGKGYYANLYGYYGMYYASIASQYGAEGFYYQNYSDYLTASKYAGYASTDFYYAYYYQYYGY